MHFENVTCILLNLVCATGKMDLEERRKTGAYGKTLGSLRFPIGTGEGERIVEKNLFNQV